MKNKKSRNVSKILCLNRVRRFTRKRGGRKVYANPQEQKSEKTGDLHLRGTHLTSFGLEIQGGRSLADLHYALSSKLGVLVGPFGLKSLELSHFLARLVI